MPCLEFAFCPHSPKKYLQQKAAAAATATTMAKQYGKLYKNLPGQRPSGPAAKLVDKRSEQQQQQKQKEPQ